MVGSGLPDRAGGIIEQPNQSGAGGFSIVAPEELRDALRHQPFEAFRLVMTDGTGYDIGDADRLWVGQRSAMVGLTGDPVQPFYERTVKADLLHVIRLEPLAVNPPSNQNGPS
jgi:hypothetical protein